MADDAPPPDATALLKVIDGMHELLGAFNQSLDAHREALALHRTAIDGLATLCELQGQRIDILTELLQAHGIAPALRTH